MTTITDSDLSLLVFGADEIKCENKHTLTPVCTHDVVYRVTGCKGSSRCCDNAINAPETGVRSRMAWHSCAGCGRPARDCWKILPV